MIFKQLNQQIPLTGITIKKLCFLALLVTLLIVTKLAFQAIPYVEFVSFLFVVYGITLTLKENWIIFIVFFITNMAINGFGLYWFPYFIFFPITFTLMNVFQKHHQRYLIASILVINCGFLIFASYFIYDTLLFGKVYAITAGTMAFWFNFLEGAINALAIFFVGIPLIKVIEYAYKKYFFETNLFKKHQFSTILTWRKKAMMILALGMSLTMFSLIPVYLFVMNKNNPSGLERIYANTGLSWKNKNKNDCLIVFEKTNLQITDLINECSQFSTLGEYLDNLDTREEWEVNFIKKRAVDFNFDGKNERFIGSINNKKQNFNTTGECAFILIDDTPSPVGADMLIMKSGHLYKLQFSSTNC